jgi:GTPase SAR1 family protein
MSGAEAFVGPGAKIATDLIVRAVPWGFALIRAWWVGKEILFVGQARAGKSTIRDYLLYRIFDDIKPTDETPGVDPSGRREIIAGDNHTLKLDVSTAVDVAGQVGATRHAQLAFERNPHVLLVVLDMTTPLDGEPDRASATWLTRFCRNYEALWRVNRGKRSRLFSMIIIMNKAEEISDDELKTRRNKYNEIVLAELRDALGRMLAPIAIMPCTAVRTPRNPKGAESMVRVIEHMAKANDKRKRES